MCEWEGNGMLERLEVVEGDITTLNVDAIVNAANEHLAGGSGVDGAIHRAAGPDLLKECRALGGCSIGEAKVTKGYDLLAKNVIHTVGPIWHGGLRKEEKLLASAYSSSLEKAVEVGAKTVAFPAISTGVYHFPPDTAASIAVKTTVKFLENNPSIEKVVFCCFSPQSAEYHRHELQVLDIPHEEDDQDPMDLLR